LLAARSATMSSANADRTMSGGGELAIDTIVGRDAV
jgi:hypothetical protein